MSDEWNVKDDAELILESAEARLYFECIPFMGPERFAEALAYMRQLVQYAPESAKESDGERQGDNLGRVQGGSREGRRQG